MLSLRSPSPRIGLFFFFFKYEFRTSTIPQAWVFGICYRTRWIPQLRYHYGVFSEGNFGRGVKATLKSRPPLSLTGSTYEAPSPTEGDTS
jgi:hypothetical protein